MDPLWTFGLLRPKSGGASVPAPEASFTADSAGGDAPVTVALTNTSTGDITDYDWDFGDGSAHATTEDASHEYTDAGTYTVTLTVTGPGGSDQATTVITIYETIVLQPDAAAGMDTIIYAYVASANSNFGTRTTISAGGAPAEFAGIQRGLIKFDLSSVPAGAIIDTSTLALYCSAENDTTDRVIGVHRALTQWFEGVKNNATPDVGQDGSTWNRRNHNGDVVWAGGVGGSAGSDWVALATDTETITGTGVTFTWAVTADVAAFVAGTATNHGWWLINVDAATNSSNKSFDSSDGATADRRPKLTTRYTMPGA